MIIYCLEKAYLEGLQGESAQRRFDTIEDLIEDKKL